MKRVLTIFYADDDCDDLDTFRDVTTSLSKNIRVFTHSGSDNLLMALQNPPQPQIIFLDLNMPGKSGFDILKELKASKKFKKIPVVIFSTAHDAQTVSKSMQMGASFYLPKSNNFEAFKKSVAFTLSINWKTFKPSPSNFLYEKQ